MKLNWNFPKGGGLGKNPFCWEGICALKNGNVNVKGFKMYGTSTSPFRIDFP